MGRACHLKGRETGFWYEIKCLEDIITSKKERGMDASFEEGILKSYRKYSEKSYAERPAEIVSALCE